MKKKLAEISQIQMGYSFRTKLELSEGDGIFVIQMKDLTEENTVSSDHLLRSNQVEAKDSILVRKGDLIFRSRGGTNNSAIVLNDLPPAVVAAPLFRIRISNPSSILPEYINWYLSSPNAQRYFAGIAEGSSQRMISKSSLEDLEVPIPSTDKQKKIIELQRLAQVENRILHRLAKKKKLFIEKVLMNTIKEDI